MGKDYQRVAIIGSGISGLGAAYLLNDHYDITVYEKNEYVGGHSRTCHISYNGKGLVVDTGFIVFNHKNYPNLTALLNKLDVPTHKTSMSFGFKADNQMLEWGAESLNALFAQRRNLVRPKFYRFLLDVLKFNRQALNIVHRYPSMSLKELITYLGLGEWFCQYYVLPMGGAIWSCQLEDILKFPASFFVNFFDAHGLLSINNQPQWYTVTDGSENYVRALTKSFVHKIHTSEGVQEVTRKDGKVQVTNKDGEEALFDHVIFSCHAPEVLSLLKDATADERNIFSVFRDQKNIAVLHKDASLMPRRRPCWSSWVYHAPSMPSGEAIMVTYWMNQLQGIEVNCPLFVTLNPHVAINESDIFDRHVFYHPVYDPLSVAAQSKISALQGQNNTWFCGAYNGYGFHEDGLVSAVKVAERMGVPAPWF